MPLPFPRVCECIDEFPKLQTLNRRLSVEVWDRGFRFGSQDVKDFGFRVQGLPGPQKCGTIIAQNL